MADSIDLITHALERIGKVERRISKQFLITSALCQAFMHLLCSHEDGNKKELQDIINLIDNKH